MSLPHHRILCVDASRCRSGGAIVHMEGIFKHLDIKDYPFDEIQVFSFKGLLEKLPNEPWLKKIEHPLLERSLPFQLLWQLIFLPLALYKTRASLLFTVDASSLCFFKPQVSLSQDLLAYEEGMIESFPLGYDKFRLYLILWLQNRTFKRSKSVIFLSEYARNLTQKICGSLNNVKIIPHGISDSFKESGKAYRPKEVLSSPINCVYVSHVELYKNQWNVIEAISNLRKEGLPVSLTLYGGEGSTSKAKQLLDESLRKHDPRGEFVFWKGPVSNGDLPRLLLEQDIFIFASSCENMPNTLVEGMTIGLPIACSKEGPMPEILKEGGTYFDPLKPRSIQNAIKTLIENNEKRIFFSTTAKKLASVYSWERCSRETFGYLGENLKEKDE